MKRAHVTSFAAAIEAGWNPSRYEGSQVPEGTWVGRLDFEAWTETGRGLSCNFTREDENPGRARGEVVGAARGGSLGDANSGGAGGARDESVERYRIAAFSVTSEGSRWTTFAPRDGSVDVSTAAATPGDRFLVSVGRTRSGSARWLSAERIGAERIGPGRASAEPSGEDR